MKGRRKAAPSTVVGGDLKTEPPEHLDKHAARVWRETVTVLKDAGRPLQELHREVLDGLCQASSDIILAGEIIAREGLMVDGGREGFKRHPASSLRSQALTIKRAYLAELGMTPTSGSRLPVVPKAQEINEFEAI